MAIKINLKSVPKWVSGETEQDIHIVVVHEKCIIANYELTFDGQKL